MGIESGIYTVGLAEIMDLDLFINTNYCFRDLKVTEDDIPYSNFDSIKLSVDALKARQISLI